MASGSRHVLGPEMKDIRTDSEGTGSKFAVGLIIACGVCSLVASLISFVAIWLQWKNYRKPLLQRYVVRILLMVPIYAASSWGSLMSLTAALYLDPFRDIYEAFTIYTFLQLLINFIGDPHTFLAMKRGILQYAWLKPILAVATIVMKLTGVYNEGSMSATSGYLWTGILYNVSVCLSLYSLAMFWVCMGEDLKPFRPVPKFLCIKLIIFASYWQGFFLSLLQWGGAIPSGVGGYGSADNVAAAIQDALICFEMPLFAISHWYAFSWHDYADVTISAARMPVKYAFRDSFGARDLIEDTKETFVGEHYEYRSFDSGDNVLAHEESDSRVARLREGMRYARGGKGKYWIPKPGEINSRTPLLGSNGGPSSMNDGSNQNGTMNGELDGGGIDPEDERLFESARELEFGDWNYPVITAHVPSKDRWVHGNPGIITPATNRHLLHPTELGKERRQERIEELFKGKSKTRSTARRDDDDDDGDEDDEPELHTRAPVVSSLIREDSTTSSKSAKSGRSQLVDLVVQDEEADEAEMVRARKEGGSAWNEDMPKHFVRTYDDDDHGEAIRHGFEPSDLPASYNVGGNSGEADDDDGDNEGQSSSKPAPGSFAALEEHRNVWGSPSNK